jgi:nitrite reductase/ring-hydroxylating ferredoxin subunit
VDREALDHSLARRLIDHIENGTTDLDDGVLEVPSEIYTSAWHLQRELEVLFHARPLVLCLSGALPGPNTYKAVDLCGTPVLLTRDAEGKVHAMANACRHRGVRVADGCGQARRLTCPFHAWTYDTTGQLVGLPTAAACLRERPAPADRGGVPAVGQVEPLRCQHLGAQLAVVRHAVEAPPAGPAGGRDGREHPVAHRRAADLASDRLDDPAAFVAGDDREREVRQAPNDREVGVADPAGPQAHEHVAGADGRGGQVLDDERPVDVVGDGDPHRGADHGK